MKLKQTNKRTKKKRKREGFLFVNIFIIRKKTKQELIKTQQSNTGKTHITTMKAINLPQTQQI